MSGTFEADDTIGVVGAGVMGRGVAQVMAEAGMTVLLGDFRETAVRDAHSFCATMLRRKADKGQLTGDEAETILDRIRPTDVGASGSYAEFNRCSLVVEAVAERMDVSTRSSPRSRAPSATTASSPRTPPPCRSPFAAAARRPERVAGFHFFNPVPLMRLV